MGQARRIVNAVFISGGVDYLEEYEQRINAVTAEQVQKVAIAYLKPQRKNVVEVRKVEGAGGAGRAGGAGVAHQRGSSVGPRGRAHSKGFKQGMQMARSAKPIDLHVPEIGKEVLRKELMSGITVFIKEDHTAPSIELLFVWTGGSNTTTVDKLAPFELASGLLDEGGTADLTPAQLQASKDELGMIFSIWFGETNSNAHFWSLKRNFDESFDLALDVMLSPRFDAERLATLKGQYIEGMRRRDESPGRAAAVLLNRVVFKDHPRLGYVPMRDEIEAVTPEQVRAIWKRHLGRDNLYITAVGDFDIQEMLELLESKLGSWREAEDSERKYITHDPFIKPGIYVVEQDLPQPAIRIYHQIDVDRTASAEDHAALEILNDILGGSGFRSRLMERLRSDEGLTYGIYSSMSHQGRPGVPGNLRIGYQTKQESVAQSIDSVLEEVQKVIEEQVGQAEVQEQIEAWRNRFVFRYTNDFFTVARLLLNELDDRPYDFDRIELDQVQKVTVKDVQRVAKKYLKPDNLTLAIFGAMTKEDRERLGEQLGVTVLEKSDVFVGGYDETAPEEAAKPAARN
jgi:zinc protease